MENSKNKIRGLGLRLVLPEGNDERIRAAAEILTCEKLAEVIVFGDDLPAPSPGAVARLHQSRPGLSEAMAAKLLQKPLYAGGALVADGKADAMLAGAASTTAKVIEAAMMTIGLAPNMAAPSSFFLMQWPNRQLIFADCGVNIQPSAGELASIALASAASARALLGEEPRVAFLSFSTKGSGKHKDADKVREALAIAQSLAPHIIMDGELQGDAALNAAIAARKIPGGGALAGNANVLVFPDLDAGNIAYKLCQELGGARANGPILQGFRAAVSDLSRGASVDDIVNTASLLLAMAAKS